MRQSRYGGYGFAEAARRRGGQAARREVRRLHTIGPARSLDTDNRISHSRWSWELTDEQRGGLTSRQFIRLQLMRLQRGEELTHVTYGNMPRRIASVDERLAAKPELKAELGSAGN